MEEPLVRGDMIGDKTIINESHVLRADAVFPLLQKVAGKKFVVTVGGPSGSGKSEIAALIGSRFIKNGKRAYVLSCDNYPHLPPRDNERRREELHAERGDQGLIDFLGTATEIDFDRLAGIVSAFKQGAATIPLRIMDNPGNKVHDNQKQIDFSAIDVLVLEGTWSALVPGPDARVFLETDFKATLEHRKKRARDPLTPFGEKVLTIEQNKLDRLKEQVELVVDLQGRVRSKL